MQHLERYLDEQIFRFNNKEEKDATRARTVIKQTDGKRLTYKKLIETMNEPQARKKVKIREATLRRLAERNGRIHTSN